MDDRAAIVIALAAAKLLKEKKKKPANDVYLAMTVSEEQGGVGSTYASKELPGDVTLAIDVGPVAKEYGTHLTDDPIIVYKDGRGTYTKKLADRLLSLSKKSPGTRKQRK